MLRRRWRSGRRRRAWRSRPRFGIRHPHGVGAPLEPRRMADHALVRSRRVGRRKRSRRSPGLLRSPDQLRRAPPRCSRCTRRRGSRLRSLQPMGEGRTPGGRPWGGGVWMRAFRWWPPSQILPCRAARSAHRSVLERRRGRSPTAAAAAGSGCRRTSSLIGRRGFVDQHDGDAVPDRILESAL